MQYCNLFRKKWYLLAKTISTIMMIADLIFSTSMSLLQNTGCSHGQEQEFICQTFLILTSGNAKIWLKRISCPDQVWCYHRCRLSHVSDLQEDILQQEFEEKTFAESSWHSVLTRGFWGGVLFGPLFWAEPS